MAPPEQALIGKKPAKVIPVPYEFRRQTLARERDTLIHDTKLSTGCVLVPHWDHQGEISKFEIFGAPAAADKAATQINQWISKSHKSTASAAWAKISAFDANKWYYEEVEGMERDRKEAYRGPIPEPTEGPPLARGTVTWPDDLVIHESITPRDVFGNNLEGLDKLRMQDEVWIRLLTPQPDAFQIEILALDQNKVGIATSHFLNLIDRIRADMGGHTLNIILDDREGMQVALQAAEVWWPRQNRAQAVPRLISHPIMDVRGTFRRENVFDPQLSKIQHAFQLALDAVRHKKGTYDMALRLGCISINVKEDEMGKVYPKDGFLKSINRKALLDVKKWLADDEQGTLIMNRLLSADFLEPTKPGYYGHKPDSLAKTCPVFRGTWVFRDPNSGTVILPTRVIFRHPGRPSPQEQAPVSNKKAPEAGQIVVQVDWTEDEDGIYEKSPPRFFKFEPNSSTKNMDINLLELGESRGWHFALNSSEEVFSNTVSPVLTGFAERLKMRPKYDINKTPGELFAQWDNTPTIKNHLVNGRLDKIYSFGIKNTCYKVELSGMWYSQGLPVWGLAIRHVAWATHLAELENLPFGEKVNWGDVISTFLPNDGDMPFITDALLKKDGDGSITRGTRLLADLMMKVSAIVSSVTGTGATGGIAL